MLGKPKQRVAALVLLFAPLAAGTVVGASCAETALMAINPCGTVLSNCTANDWYRLMVWPYVNWPDYGRDPSCIIPYGCGDWFGNAATQGRTTSSSSGSTSTTTSSTTSSSTSGLSSLFS